MEGPVGLFQDKAEYFSQVKEKKEVLKRGRSSSGERTVSDEQKVLKKVRPLRERDPWD